MAKKAADIPELVHYSSGSINDQQEYQPLFWPFWDICIVSKEWASVKDPGQKRKQLWNVIIPQVCTEVINEMIILAILHTLIRVLLYLPP